MIEPYLITSALKLDRHSLYYRVKLNPEEALAFLRKAKPHCECDPAMILRFVRAVNEYVPVMKYGPDNPNTGKMHHDFWIGRETRRVIYLDIANLAIMFGEGKGFDFVRFGNELLEIAKRFHAHEADVIRNDGFGFECRFWWKVCGACRKEKGEAE